MNKHKNGFLIEPGDEEALKDRLELLLNNPELRRTMGREGRRHVEREFKCGERGRSFVVTIKRGPQC
ncbi:MAG: glycosyltransferase [Chloroflexi bacterium]|nr:glycosyltransferase [Chloroflexota bacterium]